MQQLKRDAGEHDRLGPSRAAARLVARGQEDGAEALAAPEREIATVSTVAWTSAGRWRTEDATWLKYAPSAASSPHLTAAAYSPNAWAPPLAPGAEEAKRDPGRLFGAEA